MDDNVKNKKKENIVRIVVPIAIALLVLGIWYFKDAESTQVAESFGVNSDFALNATDETDFEELKSYGLPILINFGADYCPACVQMEPTTKKMHKELQGKAIIKYVDIAKYRGIASNYPVSVIPTQVLIDSNGNPYVPRNFDSPNITMYTSRDSDEHAFTVHMGGMTESVMLDILIDMGMEQ